jgi:hypothetical protein
VLEAQPNKSDRTIAKQTKSSPTTVGKVRKQKEAAGLVSTADTRTDARGRQQPATKPKAKAKKAKQPLPECPICEGEGSYLMNLYGPCGVKENSEPLRGNCHCITMKRDDPGLYEKLRKNRAEMVQTEQQATKSQPMPGEVGPMLEPVPKANGALPPASEREAEMIALKRENLALKNEVADLEAEREKLNERIVEVEGELARERFEHDATHGLYHHAIEGYPGVLTRDQYRQILSYLHPDRVQDEEQKKQLAEALQIFKSCELRILKKAPHHTRGLGSNEAPQAGGRKRQTARRKGPAGKGLGRGEQIEPIGEWGSLTTSAGVEQTRPRQHQANRTPV